MAWTAASPAAATAPVMTTTFSIANAPVPGGLLGLVIDATSRFAVGVGFVDLMPAVVSHQVSSLGCRSTSTR